MISVRSFNDLRAYGINALTGEACAYGMRVLCDLDQNGAIAVAQYLGIADINGFAKNWNSFVEGQPAIASVMLDYTCLHRLAAFLMFSQSQCAVVIIAPDSGSIGLRPDDRYFNEYLETAQESGWVINRNPNLQSVTGRNIHAFTGRTV